MKQYSFLIESNNNEISYHVRNISELDNEKILQVCDLINQIISTDNEFESKLGKPLGLEQNWNPSILKKAFINNSNFSYTKIFTSEIKNNIIGLVLYNEYNDKKDWGKIRFVVVDEKYRGSGIGSNLMNLTKKWVKKNRSVENLIIQVVANNAPANSLYKKFGFKNLRNIMTCKL